MIATEQPNVVVKIPEVRLRLEDVTYLRSLTAPNGAHCAIPSERIHKLVLLGLVEKKMIPPTDEEMAKLKADLAKLVAQAHEQLDKGTFDRLDGYALRRAREKMDPHEKLVLTASGAALLKSGTVTVKMAKRGCL